MKTDQGGINLWRQIGETLAEEIDSGAFVAGERLPASADLAARFGVNQHTVLRAIAHLQNEGLVRIERGRGTYVSEVIPYRMSARSRFEENLRELNRAPSRTLLAIEDLPATPAIAEALSLPPQAPLTLVMQLATADGAPVSLNRNYFPRDLLPGIAEAYRAAEQADAPDLATTKILASLGVADFRRRTIRIRGRAATDLETRHLRMVPNEPVFEVEVLNVDAEARPVTLGLTSFCQSRVEFFWDYPDTEDRT